MKSKKLYTFKFVRCMMYNKIFVRTTFFTTIIGIPFYFSSFPQLFYPLMTRQFFCDFHEKSEDFCVS